VYWLADSIQTFIKGASTTPLVLGVASGGFWFPSNVVNASNYVAGSVGASNAVAQITPALSSFWASQLPSMCKGVLANCNTAAALLARTGVPMFVASPAADTTAIFTDLGA
jgi:hypothetical protein